MDIHQFISNFKNHPVLFLGTGLSMRYLKQSYTWEGLLKKIASEINADPEYYLDIVAKCNKGDSKSCDFAAIASSIEKDFNNKFHASEERHGKFEAILDEYYKFLAENKRPISLFKLYIANLLKNESFKEESSVELNLLKSCSKNICSAITTNYDKLAEKILKFQTVIGNDLLLSEPYGSVYKIHGCITQPEKIIITQEDYKKFESEYELIRAQLLSIFMHNPIIFMGYKVQDENIKKILSTIYKYTDNKCEQSIRNNFLLVEYDKGSNDTTVIEHDITINNGSTIKIHKIATDNFSTIYKAINNLTLPVSVIDIRKVKNIVKNISEGGNIKVQIEDSIDNLETRDKILFIGSKERITYKNLKPKNFIDDYFKIVNEKDVEKIKVLNDTTISKNENFPIFGFSRIYKHIKTQNKLKAQQIDKIREFYKNFKKESRYKDTRLHYKRPKDVFNDPTIAKSKQLDVVMYCTLTNTIEINSLREYLDNYEEDKTTTYRKLLCIYDLMAYAEDKEKKNAIAIKS